MKKMTGRCSFLVKILVVLSIGITLGTILMVGVFSIPTDRINKNVKDSTYIFDLEGTYPSINKQPSKMLDNYTDGLMLIEAVYNKDNANVVEKAMAVYKPVIDDFTPDRTLSVYMNKEGDYPDGSYKRYWHGFLVILKPMLLFCNYLGFRSINKVLQVVLAVLIMCCFFKKKMGRMIIPFLLSYLFLRPDALGLSLQYSSVYYITALSILFLVLCKGKIERYNLYPFVFLVTGMSTSYFDFLTYPLVTLGLPLTVVTMYRNKDKVFDKIKRVFGYSIMWGTGYVGMWSGKWLVGGILLKENLFMDALNTIKFRSSTHYNKVEFTYGDVFNLNINVGFGGILGLCAIIVIVLLAVAVFLNRKDLKRLILESLPFLIIMTMPFCWYILAANHSYIHSGFTYRELVITVFAFLCMGFRALHLNKKFN